MQFRQFLLRSTRTFSKVIFIACFFASCQQENKSKEKVKNQISFDKAAEILLRDTSAVNPLIDSLRKEIFTVDGEQQLLLLGELAENWRINSFILSKEEFTQSKKINYLPGEGD